MKSWVEFWNTDTPIYVNARHKLLHYRLIADDIAALVPDRAARVLDFGCGEALGADRLLARCGTLLLADAAPSVRDKLAKAFAGEARIEVLAPDQVAALPAGTLDLVIVHSVAQYLTKAEFAALTAMLAGRLKPGGSLVVGDILPSGLSALTDALALLTFARKGGFLMPALAGLARTALSDYRTIRNRLGLTHFDAAEMLAVLAGAGLAARRLATNLGHNQARMAFRGIKAAAPDQP